MSVRVVISGAGAASAAGLGVARLAEAVKAGKSLARPCSLFDASSFPVPDACEVPALDPRALALKPKDAKVLARASVVALAALEDLRAGFSAPFVSDPWKAGFFLGVGLEQSDHRDMPAALAVSRTPDAKLSIERLAKEGVANMNPLAALRTLPNLAMCHLGMKLGDTAPRGANAAYSPFDAAAIEAVGAAAASVRRRECEVALAGGADSFLSVFGWTMLSRLGLLSDARRAGEGAALFVVEDAKRAAGAGRPILAEITGMGSAGDATATGKDGLAAAKQAIRTALSWDSPDPAPVDAAILSGATDAAALESIVKGARAVHPRAVIGESGAGTGALGIALAVSEIAAGARRALATGCGWGGSHAAILLSRWKE